MGMLLIQRGAAASGGRPTAYCRRTARATNVDGKLRKKRGGVQGGDGRQSRRGCGLYAAGGHDDAAGETGSRRAALLSSTAAITAGMVRASNAEDMMGAQDAASTSSAVVPDNPSDGTTVEGTESTPGTNSGSQERIAFLDVAVDGAEPLGGRVVIRLFPSAPSVASARIYDIISGSQVGLTYRNLKVDKITDAFLEVEGLRNVRYGSSPVTIAGGPDNASVRDELTVSPPGEVRRRHDAAGLVSLVATVPPSQVSGGTAELIARDGKLMSVVKGASQEPNGTAIVITLPRTGSVARARDFDCVDGSWCSLDEYCIVVGEVVQGLDVLERIRDGVPTNKGASDSGFFKLASAAGDSRAKVAARAFNKPLQKVFIERCGAGTGD